MNVMRPLMVFGMVVSMLLVTGPAHAEIKIPNLNPFAKKSEPSKKPESKSSFSGSASAVPKKTPNEPSTLEKMGRDTKAFFTKTADVLNPFNDAPKEKTASRRDVTGSNSYFTSNSGAPKKAEKKSSFFPFSIPSPFKSKETKPYDDYEKPRGVNDFLKQPRVPIE